MEDSIKKIAKERNHIQMLIAKAKRKEEESVQIDHLYPENVDWLYENYNCTIVYVPARRPFTRAYYEIRRTKKDD